MPSILSSSSLMNRLKEADAVQSPVIFHCSVGYCRALQSQIKTHANFCWLSKVFWQKVEAS